MAEIDNGLCNDTSTVLDVHALFGAILAIVLLSKTPRKCLISPIFAILSESTNLYAEIEPKNLTFYIKKLSRWAIERLHIDNFLKNVATWLILAGEL